MKYCNECTKAITHIKIQISFLKIINFLAKLILKTFAKIGNHKIIHNKCSAISQVL